MKRWQEVITPDEWVMIYRILEAFKKLGQSRLKPTRAVHKEPVQ